MRNFFYNLFIFLCIVLVIGAFIYTARPQWFTGIAASNPTAGAGVVTHKATLILPVAGQGPPTATDGADVRHLIDAEEKGLPSRVNPYLVILNTCDKTIRHYRLTSNVKSVVLKQPSPDIVVKKSWSLNSQGPIQLEFWLANEREITLDVEYTQPSK